MWKDIFEDKPNGTIVSNTWFQLSDLFSSVLPIIMQLVNSKKLLPIDLLTCASKWLPELPRTSFSNFFHEILQGVQDDETACIEVCNYLVDKVSHWDRRLFELVRSIQEKMKSENKQHII